MMIIDSLLPNTIGTQSIVGTVDDDFPFPKGYVMVSPLKINMEHNHGGLEDNFPF